MNKIEQLVRKGVTIPNPAAVHIGDEVDVDRISGRGVIIHGCCKLFGSRTLLCDGAQIGFEGPATIEDCFVGPAVSLKGGFFSRSAFLEKSSCGLGAHVREGTILEEQASIAHTVGLKQTILFPYVALGSLINFCDCLMGGGTGRKNHSEVGSSYIHFNFTPNQDKATPSLIGDVPRGVMLNQSPIFLGGQGGLVGPCRIAYGTILAAGTICRKDQLSENRLVFEAPAASGSVPFDGGIYRNVNRLIGHNIHYIGNLIALKQWYAHVRTRFTGPGFPEPLLEGLRATLQGNIDERIRQLGLLRDKFGQAAARSDSQPSTLQQAFYGRWPEISRVLAEIQCCQGRTEYRDRLLDSVEQGIKEQGRSYLNVIHALGPEAAASGTEWLQSIVAAAIAAVAAVLPGWRHNLKSGLRKSGPGGA